MPEREALETMVAEADTGGRKPTGFDKNYDLRDLAGLGAVPALVCLAASLQAQFRRHHRRPGAHHSPVVRVPAGVRHLSRAEIVAAQPHSGHRLDPGGARRLRRDVSAGVLQRDFAAAGPADHGRTS